MSRPTRNTKFGKKSVDNSADKNRPKRPKKPRNPSSGGGASDGWLWGQHAVIAALANPDRRASELRVSPNAAARLDIDNLQRKPGLTITTTPPSELDRFLPQGASHQGFALKSAPPPDCDIPALAEPARGVILVLDKVTDPQNVGAMFRLASAFNARGIIMQDRGAPPLAGATAKVAVGAVETVPHALVTNIANTLSDLKERGWIVTGLAGEAELTITQAFALPKNASHKANVIVMGAEGPGLRPRVRAMCDHLAKIPMPGSAESLNVSTAAAIAFYEASKPI